MNEAEARRDERISRLRDPDLLELVVGRSRDEQLSPEEYAAFVKMLGDLRLGERACLSRRQRVWVEGAARRITPIRAEDAPRGREVPTPAVLRNLPKRPPRRVG